MEQHPEANDPMYVEWQAWQLVVTRMCDTFNITTDEFNAAKMGPVVSAIEAWGELLAELRSTQTETVVTEARMHACAKALQVAPR